MITFRKHLLIQIPVMITVNRHKSAHGVSQWCWWYFRTYACWEQQQDYSCIHPMFSIV